MVRRIGSVVLAVLIGSFVIFIMEYLGHLIFLLPDGINIEDYESIRNNSHLIPVQNHISVLISHILGAFVAGYAIKKISPQYYSILLISVAAILTAFTIVNLFFLPHPIWFIIADICIYYPIVRLGSKL